MRESSRGHPEPRISLTLSTGLVPIGVAKDMQSYFTDIGSCENVGHLKRYVAGSILLIYLGVPKYFNLALMHD